MRATHALPPHLKSRRLLHTVFNSNISPKSDADQIDTGFAVLREIESLVRRAEISAEWYTLLAEEHQQRHGQCLC